MYFKQQNMGKLEEAQILWNAIGTESEPDANTTTRVRNAATKIIDFIAELVNTVSNKVDKVTGKGLSTNDYSNEAKAEVGKVTDKVDKVAGKDLSTNDYSNEASTEVGKIKDKVDKVTGKGLSTNDFSNEAKVEVAKVTDKVDKIEGKGLSTNDFSNAEKQKLASMNLNLNMDLTGIFNFMNQFLTTNSGELILDQNNNIIVTI